MKRIIAVILGCVAAAAIAIAGGTEVLNTWSTTLGTNNISADGVSKSGSTTDSLQFRLTTADTTRTFPLRATVSGGSPFGGGSRIIYPDSIAITLGVKQEGTAGDTADVSFALQVNGPNQTSTEWRSVATLTFLTDKPLATGVTNYYGAFVDNKDIGFGADYGRLIGTGTSSNDSAIVTYMRVDLLGDPNR